MKAGQYFTVAEFDSRDGVRVPVAQLQAIRHLCEWWLDPLRREFGRVTVHSGYRSARHNASVGGARASVHLLRTPLPARPPRSSTMAAAADVSCERGTVAQWTQWARTHRFAHAHLSRRGRGGIGDYPRQGFIHLDTSWQRDWHG